MHDCLLCPSRASSTTSKPSRNCIQAQAHARGSGCGRSVRQEAAAELEAAQRWRQGGESRWLEGVLKILDTETKINAEETTTGMIRYTPWPLLSEIKDFEEEMVGMKMVEGGRRGVVGLSGDNDNSEDQP
jgi:hypothetical protein